MAKPRKHKIVIGKTDIADFPDLGLNHIKIKIDTGAYTSAIHCKSAKVKDGLLYCTFDNSNSDSIAQTFKEYRTLKVKSSNGLAQYRYEIKTKIKLFNKIYKISLSLSDRKGMRNPVLIGRKFLNPKFIIDPSLKDLSFNNKKYEFKNTL